MRLGRIMTFEVVISLAGRTKLPAALPGEVRRGGFGGPEGLARYLTEARIDLRGMHMYLPEPGKRTRTNLSACS